jgi:hypothetical protein
MRRLDIVSRSALLAAAVVMSTACTWNDVATATCESLRYDAQARSLGETDAARGTGDDCGEYRKKRNQALNP